MQNLFIFQAGCYEAEGELTITMFNEPLPFSMKWHVFHHDQDTLEIECCQEIKIKGFKESLYNQYTFSPVKNKSFPVAFENVNLGRIEGMGVVEPNFIGWEFRNLSIDYEGYEYYERRGENEYDLRAAFVSSDGQRTEIWGHLNRKTVENVI